MPSLSNSPFGQPSSFQHQQQQQQQHGPQQPQVGLPTAQPGQSPFNPFQSTTAPNTQLNGYNAQSPFGYQQPAQPFAPQPTGRVDKNSILALYNLSARPPAIPEQQAAQPQAAAGGIPTSQGPNPLAQQANAPQAPGTQNPFLGFSAAPGSQNSIQATTQPSTYAMNVNSVNPAANTGFIRTHMSQQSVDINGFQNGRHSPDAFASLSARQGR
jgi:hypothetical protein